TGIRRRRCQDRITGVEKELGYQVQRHLGTGSHQNVFGNGLDAFKGHDLLDFIDKLWLSHGCSILECRKSVLGHDFVADAGTFLPWQMRQFRVASRQGDDIRVHLHLKDSTNGRGRKVSRARGKTLVEGEGTYALGRSHW